MNAVSDPIRFDSQRTPYAGAESGWRAELELGFELRRDRTTMVRNRHVGPLTVQKPLYPEGGRVCHAIMLHPPAGIVGGDSLAIRVDVGEGAHALLTTPGAGKWYRSGGRLACLSQRIEVAAGAACEWLPQESIVFDGAQARLSTEVALAPGATFIGSEMLCFGRTGSGERFDHGELAMNTRVSVGGAPVWLERGRIAGNSPLLASQAGLGTYPVVATMLAIGPGVDEALRDACREIPASVGEGAVTLLPGVLVARWIGPAVEPGRAWFEHLWARVRPALTGEPMRVPRIWLT